MAAIGAVFLLLAAATAVVLRFRADRAAMRTGASSTLWTSSQNKKVGVGVIIAVLLAILLFAAIQPFNWLVELFPGLLAVGLSLVLVAMAVESGSNIGAVVGPYVWGYTLYQTDATAEPRIDPFDPTYDSRLDESHADFDPDFARAEGLVVEEGRPLGTLLLAAGTAAIVLYGVIALLIAALFTNISFGSMGGSEPTPPGATATAPAPEPKPSTAAPSPTPSDTPSASPKPEKSTTGKGKQPTKTTDASCAEIIAWLLPVAPGDRKQQPFGPKGVDRCVDGDWVEWTGEFPQLVEVLNTNTTEMKNLDGENERFQLYHIKWNGEDVLFRIPTK